MSRESQSRPNKAGASGHGKYCCIPGCRSAAQDSNYKSTGITLFKVPVKEPDRSNWMRIISKFRRKGGSDSFDHKKQNIYVCEFHFKPEDLRKTLGCGRKKYSKGCVPSVFDNRQMVTKPKRKSPTKRPPPIEYSSESVYETDSSLDNELLNDYEPHFETSNTLSEVEILKLEVEKLKEREKQLQTENENLMFQATQLQGKLFTYENISKDKKLFQKTTGFSHETFQILMTFLNPGEKMANVKFYDSTNRMSETSHTQLDCEFLKDGPAPALSNEEQCFLYLVWLKNGFTLAHMAFLFQISIATVSRYLITWSSKTIKLDHPSSHIINIRP